MRVSGKIDTEYLSLYYYTYCTQEPFDTLNAELLEDLTETQYHQLDQALPKYDLGTLLSTLYEFIETYIRHIDMNMKILGLAIVHTCNNNNIIYVCVLSCTC